MSAFTLKKLLVEKERAFGRRQLINACIGLATTFSVSAFGYSTLTYLAAQPALSRGPEDGGTSSFSSFSGKLPAQAQAPGNGLSEPESGVKLLIAIFSRLGDFGHVIAMNQETNNRWPQIAGKVKAPRDSAPGAAADGFAAQHAAPEQQFSQALTSNVADPALSIRPQVAKRNAADEVSDKLAEKKEAAAPMERNLNQLAINAPAAPPAVMNQKTRDSRGQSGWYKSGSQAAETDVYKQSMPSKVVSESPSIREFDQGARRDTAADMRTKSLAKRQVNIIDEPLGRARMERSNLIDQAKDNNGAGSEGVAGIIRPTEQPGLFKYVREYLKESPKNMAPPAGAMGAPLSAGQLEGAAAGDAKSSNEEVEDFERKPARLANAAPVNKPGSAAGGGGAGSMAATYGMQMAGGKGVSMTVEAEKDASRGYNITFRNTQQRKKAAAMQQLAFLPPNAVHGIPGLNLGATTFETTTYLKSRGKFSKQSINGFQVFSLKGDRGNTLLQAFVRNERLEGLRVFSRLFVPPQLGVTLGDELTSMKSKFGEAAFILEEPKSGSKAPQVMAKNYVYPVSQVSFQLSRNRSAGGAPQIMSFFLFRFL